MKLLTFLFFLTYTQCIYGFQHKLPSKLHHYTSSQPLQLSPTDLMDTFNSYSSGWAQAIDTSVLGLLKPSVFSDLLNSLHLDSVTRNIYIAADNVVSPLLNSGEMVFNKLLTDVPQFNDFVVFINEILRTQASEGAKLVEAIEKNQIFQFLDISKYSILPSGLNEYLATQPKIIRMGLGLALIDILPFAVDALILKTIFKKTLSAPFETDPTGLPNTYNIKQISEFYEKRPQVVLARVIQLLNESSEFLFGLFNDQNNNKFKENAPLRAKQLRELIQKLGPAFIKVGQGVSIRPDLLSPPYLEELVKLQDQVPPFDSNLALKLIEKELGTDPNNIFENVEKSFEKPVAAASLGQVYKAQLKNRKYEDSEYVAVKVQRPFMKVAVTLDLYIIRSLLVLGKNYENVREECESFIMVIDNWAGRFVDELDYIKEAENSNLFRSQMERKETTLGDAVIVPKTYTEFSTEKILTTEWVDGTKLNSIDINTEIGLETKKKLTRVLLNSYLVQLLETGFLHADPHPGNFLVTDKGKLCILDYGLMTDVAEDRRYGLLEYVAHLLAKDYDATLEDLVVLGFIPREIQDDPKKREIVAPRLANVLEQLSAGGGAANVNVQEVGLQIEELGKQYPIIIPDYFGLIVRAFGALEGIGLSIEPNYSIVNECFPYLARRLLSDDSDRVRNALKTFLYGTKGRLDVERVEDLARGYQTFTTTAAEAKNGNIQFQQLKQMQLIGEVKQGNNFASQSVSPVSLMEIEKPKQEIDPTINEAVGLIFSAQGNYVQDLIIDESVRIVDAFLRSSSWTLFTSIQEALKPPVFLPRPAVNPGLPSLVLSPARIDQILTPNEEDIEALRTLKRLLELLADENTKFIPQNGNFDNHISNGKIDQDDILLARNAVSNVLKTVSGEKNGKRLTFQDLMSFAQNMQKLQQSKIFETAAPGLIAISRKFSRRLISTSLKRIAEKVEEMN